MRWILTAGACAVMGSVAFAQQDPQFSQYMFDRLSINSAVAGSTGNICATALLRQQWSGFSGAPKTGLINVQGALEKINSGLGLSVYYDKLGYEKNTIARVHYAYHLKVGSQSTLSAGIYAGLSGRAFEANWIAIDDWRDDASIPNPHRNDSGFDLGAGLYYRAPNMWLGISSTQLPETELKNVSIQNRRHYYVQAGYDWAIGGNKKYTLQPSILLKSDASSTQLDIGALFLYDEMIWAGVGFRTEDAIAPMIGYQHQFPNGNSLLRIGYSYDVTTSELKNYSSGSHEIMLSYCFKIIKPEVYEIYHHPIFL